MPDRAPTLSDIDDDLDAIRTGRDARGEIVDRRLFGFRVSYLWGVATGLAIWGAWEIWSRVM